MFGWFKAKAPSPEFEIVERIDVDTGEFYYDVEFSPNGGEFKDQMSRLRHFERYLAHTRFGNITQAENALTEWRDILYPRYIYSKIVRAY